VLIVGVDPVVVEADLVAGRLVCPVCATSLRRWGWARERELRSRAGTRRFRPRRGLCTGCGSTHVLLPEDGLARRRDAVADIGDALVAKAAGSGHRPIAARLGVPAATVRGWLRRFGAMAERIREHFTRWAVALDPMLGPVAPAGSAFADAVGAIGAAAAAAVRRLGPRPPWRLASSLTGGGLLATRAALWAAPG
jgi:transposase-like protein